MGKNINRHNYRCYEKEDYDSQVQTEDAWDSQLHTAASIKQQEKPDCTPGFFL